MLFMVGLLTLAVSRLQPWVHEAAYSSSADASQSSEDPDALLNAYEREMLGKRFEDALAIARKLRPVNAEGQALVDALQASALLGLNRESEARALIAKAEQLAPLSVDTSRAIFAASLLSDHPQVAADALDRMIARAPDVVRDLKWELVRYFLGHEPKDQETRNEDRRIALARIGYGGDTEVGHWRAADAVDILVKRSDFRGAAELLQYVNEPEAYEKMLIQKRYAPLWPRLEELAGPHLVKVRESSLRSIKLEYDQAPNDHQKLQLYINALRHAGRLDEAVVLRSALPATAAAMASADEPMGWAINNVALALHESGRADDADRLFAMLNDAPMAEEYWRVSMKINRLELLVRDGKFDKALPLLEPTARTKGSPYADQLVRRLRYCILSSIGQKEQAAKYLPDMLQHAVDAPAPTIDGLLCAGDLDQAEKVAFDALKGEKKEAFEEDFVAQLQMQPLTSDDPSVWQRRWQELRSRPAIKREFDRLGRDMPAEYLPPAGSTASAK
jgi:hypothetical protein